MNLIERIKARFTKVGKYSAGPRRAFYMRSNTIVNEDTSMQVAAFNRGLIYISTQIAKLPWNVKDKDNTIVLGAQADLLNLAANPEMNAFRWRLMMVQQSIIHGNAYSEIERDGAGRAIALWPLYSQNMELVRTDSDKLVYKYMNPDGGTVYLNPRDVYHLPNFHTKDGMVGQGVVAYGRDVLGIQIAADEMASGIFHNGGIPSGVLTHPGKLSDDAYKRLKESWEQQNGGRKSGGTSLLEEGVKYEPMNVDPNTLQFLQSRQFGILEIARFLGVPPTKLFDVTAATYSNVENANLEVATDTLDSWATNLEMEADVKILNNRFAGRFTDIDLYSIFRGDMKTRSDYFKSMMSVGAITPNQIRAKEGLPPYKDGDSYYIATNNFTPADMVDDVIQSQIDKNKQPPASPEPKGNPPSALEEAAIKFLSEPKK